MQPSVIFFFDMYFFVNLKVYCFCIVLCFVHAIFSFLCCMYVCGGVGLSFRTTLSSDKIDNKLSRQQFLWFSLVTRKILML